MFRFFYKIINKLTFRYPAYAKYDRKKLSKMSNFQLAELIDKQHKTIEEQLIGYSRLKSLYLKEFDANNYKLLAVCANAYLEYGTNECLDELIVSLENIGYDKCDYETFIKNKSLQEDKYEQLRLLVVECQRFIDSLGSSDEYIANYKSLRSLVTKIQTKMENEYNV